MSLTVCRRADEETKSTTGGAFFARVADFDELYLELIEESGRALEEGDLDWCALLQGVLIPKIEAEGLGMRAAS